MTRKRKNVSKIGGGGGGGGGGSTKVVSNIKLAYIIWDIHVQKNHSWGTFSTFPGQVKEK